MNTHLIELGDHLRDELRWLVFYRSYDPDLFNKGDAVFLDFSKVSFIIPYCLLGLLAYCKSTFRKTKVKVTLCNISSYPTIYQYMERADFFTIAADFVQVEGDYSEVFLWDRDHVPRKMHGIVEIGRNRIDSANKIAQTIDELTQRYDDILDFFASKHENGHLFFTILSEITANIPEHSRSKGYLLVQKYESQNKRTISTSVSIMDNGVGIRSRLEEQVTNGDRRPLKNVITDSDYLKFAFSEKGTRSGAGLNSVIRSLKEWDSHDTAILVVSGRGVMYKGQDSNKITFSDEQLFFRGTHTTIWFYGDLET
jgi:hypothetical protein